MAVRKILIYPKDGSALRKKSTKVERIDKSVRELIRDLKDTLSYAGGAGLASPQIGVYQRVILVRLGQDEGKMKLPIALINPEIIKFGVPEKGFDGCLSFPNIYTWETIRPNSLVFSALDDTGKRLQLHVNGIDARLVHHEIDHLDGKLFIDLVQSASDLYKAIETPEGEKLVSFDLLTAWLMSKDRIVI
jgi:peptide deformylase